MNPTDSSQTDRPSLAANVRAGGATALSNAEPTPTVGRTLQRLFLTIFLRGHSSRGLNKNTAPKSIGSKLALTLFIYFCIGLMATMVGGSGVFFLSIYLHSMTFIFLGLFAASAAGEVLFNKEEADILMHRPLEPRALLWAKMSVLIKVSLWMAAALNIAGIFVGAFRGGWIFAIVHPISIALEVFFSIGCVVLVYQLCLRWLGRECLDGLMTTAQVVVSIGAVAAGQLLPRFSGQAGGLAAGYSEAWWTTLLPPAWFAGLDDALAGSRTAASWELAVAALLATALVTFFAVSRLANTYQVGLQALNETISPVRRRRGKRWLAVLIDWAPMRWWLREPIERAAFLLTAAYLVRDRDVKLRVFPAMGPTLMIPVMMLFGPSGAHRLGESNFIVAMIGTYLGIVPLLGLSMLEYSAQWRAADIFRAAPIGGPEKLCDGARRAVLLVLTLPVFLVFLLILYFVRHGSTNWLLLLPGIVSLPAYSMIPTLGSGGVPLSRAAEDAKSVSRGLTILPVLFVSMVISGLATWAWTSGWFWSFMVGETIVATGAYVVMRRGLAAARWRALE
jgi:ABC-2 type transport system permease protein